MTAPTLPNTAMRRALFGFGFGLLGLLVVGCASVPPSTLQELAPSGTLRAAINFGNPILASQDTKTGALSGVSVDLAKELGRRIGKPVELVPFASAARVVEAIKAAQVDMAFVAIDPVRGADIRYSAPYVVIEGAYLVRQDSSVRHNNEVDRPGVRVAVGAGSAYDLYLQRELHAATLVRAPTSPAVVDFFLKQQLEVAAGVRQQLEADAQRVPGVRVLEGRFMVIQQAIGVPKGRERAAAYLHDFVEEMKASGFVALALQRHKIEGAGVAPAQAP
jgi:polar amino acid transport system substrate-binding protein